MAKASENIFPKVRMSTVSTSTAPAGGEWRVEARANGIYAVSSNTGSAGTGPFGAGGSGLADMGTATYLDFTTAAAPANPAAGKVRVYSKTGDTLSQRTSGGTETIFGAGGATAVAPDVVKVYAQTLTNSTSHAATIVAAASGNRLIVCISSYARDVNTPTCTNVTFTEVQAVTFGGAFLSVYVGVVAGGSSGTTVTVTATGANWIITDIYEVADALTPTAGASATLTNTDAAATAGTTIGRVAMAQGTFFIIAVAQDNGTTAITDLVASAFIFTPATGANAALRSGIGRAMGPAVNGYYAGGHSTADVAAGIIAIT